MAEASEDEKRDLRRRARIASATGLLAIVVACLAFAALITTLRAR